MCLIDISPPARDKRTFLQMLYDPGNLIWPKIEENPMAICLILLVFAGWNTVTHAREAQEQKGVPVFSQYICENNISTMEDTKFQPARQNTSLENEVLSRTIV